MDGNVVKRTGDFSHLHVNAFASLVNFLKKPFTIARGLFDFSPKDPDLVVHRQSKSSNKAIYLIHGFTGNPVSTWGRFPEFLLADPDLNDYDIFAWRYPTKLNPLYAIAKEFWIDDPNVATIGQALRTLLNTTAESYGKIVLVGHSMGGLAIQSFVIEEICKGRSSHLDRLTEIVLFGTPSGGLKLAEAAAELKNQIADMAIYGDFIKKLRGDWKKLVDDCRADSKRPAIFRLTLVAGLQDNFVTRESSLTAFPLDEQEHVPGTHTTMIKPLSATNDRAYDVLKQRLTRRNLSQAERQLVRGESEAAMLHINRIRAAATLGDTKELLNIDKQLLDMESPGIPLAYRVLGMALLGLQEYPRAAELLARYVDFELPDDKPGQVVRPFNSDPEAVQQLAIALSRAGKPTDALARINSLPPKLQDVPETLGILAGVLKRQWMKSGSDKVGRDSHNTYARAFKSAKGPPIFVDQAYYNGINLAYMNFALGENEFETTAKEVLVICDSIELGKRNYWSEATRAEALALLKLYPAAVDAYNVAKAYGPEDRQWSTTGQQALDIVERQGNPKEAAAIAEKFANIKKDAW